MPQVLLSVWSTAIPLNPASLAVRVSLALPAQISTKIRSPSSLPENLLPYGIVNSEDRIPLGWSPGTTSCGLGRVGKLLSWTKVPLPPHLLLRPSSLFEFGCSETNFRFPPDSKRGSVGLTCQAASFESPLQTTTECPGLWQFAHT